MEDFPILEKNRPSRRAFTFGRNQQIAWVRRQAVTSPRRALRSIEVRRRTSQARDAPQSTAQGGELTQGTPSPLAPGCGDVFPNKSRMSDSALMAAEPISVDSCSSNPRKEGSFSMAGPVRPYPTVNQHNGAAPEGHQQHYGDQVQYPADVRE